MIPGSVKSLGRWLASVTVRSPDEFWSDRERSTISQCSKIRVLIMSATFLPMVILEDDGFKVILQCPLTLDFRCSPHPSTSRSS